MDDKSETSLGAIIRARRNEVSISAEQLAALVDADQTTILRIERDKQFPSRRLRNRIEAVLNIPLDEMLAERSYGFKADFERCLKVHRFTTGIKINSTRSIDGIVADIELVRSSARNPGVRLIFNAIVLKMKDPRYRSYLAEHERIHDGILPSDRLPETEQDEWRDDLRRQIVQCRECCEAYYDNQRFTELGDDRIHRFRVSCSRWMSCQNSKPKHRDPHEAIEERNPCPRILSETIEAYLDPAQTHILYGGLTHSRFIREHLELLAQVLPED